MRIPDQLLHCRYDVYLTLQVADAIYVVCELSSKHTSMVVGYVVRIQLYYYLFSIVSGPPSDRTLNPETAVMCEAFVCVRGMFKLVGILRMNF